MSPAKGGPKSDRYQRTADGWKFTERVYQIRYLDESPLAGSAPPTAGEAH